MTAELNRRDVLAAATVAAVGKLTPQLTAAPTRNPKNLPVLQFNEKQKIINLKDIAQHPLVRREKVSSYGFKMIVWTDLPFFKHDNLYTGEAILDWEINRERKPRNMKLTETKESQDISIIFISEYGLNRNEEYEARQRQEQEQPTILIPDPNFEGFIEIYIEIGNYPKVRQALVRKGILVLQEDIWGESFLLAPPLTTEIIAKRACGSKAHSPEEDIADRIFLDAFRKLGAAFEEEYDKLTKPLDELEKKFKENKERLKKNLLG